MRLRRFLPLLGIVIVFAVVGYSTLKPGEAQVDPEAVCSPLITQALQTVGQSCAQQGRNTACYGYNRVLPEFFTTSVSTTFTRPADRAALADLEKLQTTPLDPALNEWGIAVLNVQANLPNTLPGQSAIFMLLGDTEVENAVDDTDSFVGGGPVDLVAALGANLYVRPSLNSTVDAVVPANAVLAADAISTDGEWFRVAYQSAAGWVARSVVSVPETANSLPVYNPRTSAAPMQAFYLRTTFAGLECEQAPNALVVQGTQTTAIEFNANGADIRIGSTVILRTIPFSPALLADLQALYGTFPRSAAAFLQIFVIDGEAIINPDTDDEFIVRAGETSYTCLSTVRNLGADGQSNDRIVIPGCGWMTPRGYTVDEIEQFGALDDFPLNYPIDIFPDADPPVFPTNTAVPAEPTQTPTLTGSETATFTPSPTATFTATNTATSTATFTATNTATSTETATATFTATHTSTPTDTPVGCPLPATAFTTSQLISYIEAANNEPLCPGADTITLDNEAAFPVTTAYSPGSGLPEITSTITINGNNRTINGGDLNFRLFTITVTGNLTLNNVIVTNGKAVADAGGAIYNSGTLNLNNSTVSSSASDQSGGGIFNNGTLNLTSSTISDNTAGQSGGGIFNFGTLNVGFNSHVSENAATLNGGGIYECGSFSYVSSFIDNNTADQDGGGVYMCTSSSGYFSSTTIANNDAVNGGGVYVLANGQSMYYSTLSNNTASSGGGGLAVDSGSGAAVEAINVTISTNQAGSFGSALHGKGGGANFSFVTLWNNSGGSSVRLDGGAFTFKNSVIGSDTPVSSSCSGSLPAVLGVNYTNDLDTSCIFSSGEGVAYAPLMNNGGNTSTHAPLTSNPAIDSVTDCTTIGGIFYTDDQRFFPRPQGIQCDAGAFETSEEADVQITKTVDDDTPSIGQTVTFTITVMNVGPDPVYELVISDVLPAGLTYSSHTTSKGSYNEFTGEWVFFESLFVDDPQTLTIVATAGSFGGNPVTNTASVVSSRPYDPTDSNDSASVMLTNEVGADFSLTKSVDDPTPFELQNITYTLTLTNNSAFDVDNVTVDDLLPGGVSYVSSSTSNGSYDNISGIWDIGALDALEIATLDIIVNVDVGTAGTSIVNAAFLSNSDPADPTPPNDNVQIDVQGLPDLELSANVGSETLVGTVLQVAYTLTNVGSADATNVVVTDLVPNGLSGTGTPAQGGYFGETDTWTVGTLGAGEPVTFTVFIQLEPPSSAYSTTASAATSDTESTLSNNDFMYTLNVTGADLEVSVVPVPDETTPRGWGLPVQYTVTVTNNGPQATTGVSLSIGLPAETIPTAPATVSEGAVLGSVWSSVDLNPGETATLVWNAQVNVCNFTELVYTASVISNPAGDLITDNNAMTVTHPFAPMC
ncbi:MAG: DUF11 domain-containing protein [Anaerolinea sp.]|nr:DUF11 domain-containing protein [Anaerolinea sp.]